MAGGGFKLLAASALAVGFLFPSAPALAADSIPVLNPSFQADNFPASPGYRGGANPAVISGWNGGGGINGSDIGAGVPFADNGAIADGTRVAFIQGAGTLSQTLSGFTVGQTYWVQLWTNARNCCGDQPQISVSLGAQTLLAFQTLPPAGSNASYYLTNFVWTATAPSASLSIASRSAAGGDTAAVFDAVAVIARASNEVVVANPSFEASGQGIIAPGYYPNIAGWTKFGSDEIGINTSAGPFHDNGAVPDGSNVLVLKRASGVRQTIAGLVPGQSCRLSLRYNSRAATAAPTFRVLIDGLTAFDGSVAAVGVGQAYKTLTFDFTALHETAELILESRTTGSDTAVLVDAVSLSTIGAPVLPSLALPSPGVPGGAGGIVTFNEIHYHPPAAGTPEWVELYNQNSVRVDMSGWRIKGGIAFTFPEGTVIEPGAYRVVSSIANNPAGALGPFSGALNNAGDNCKLVTRQDWLIDEIKYGVADEWPAAPDGTGATLSKRAVYFASNTSASWSASTQLGGTPGTINFASPPSGPVVPAHVAGPVVINEIFYHAHPVYADPNNGISFRENPAEWIELNNRSALAVDLSGWTLDDAIHYTFPPNSILAPNGFVVVNQTQFSGTLANSGDSIKLRDPAGVLVDKVRYRDGGRWAEYADGGGASLELLDANADNT
ncbi:MAG: exported protein of unknown function, partial [Chthoniobacteraceae bacterium]|nr:exported protein of unknown function [Chthoniobacteraceae bacterium]